MEVNSTSCVDRYDSPMFNGLLHFRSALSIVSALFIVCMLTIIILFKKYRFFTQRLILYLAISTLTYQVISTVDVTSIKAYSDKNALNYCIFIGFISQVVVWWPVMATTVIALDIFLRVVCKKSTERFEIPYVLLIFTSSVTVAWIPFIHSGFGPSRYFCWIKIENNNLNCTLYIEGVIYRNVLFLVPYCLLVVSMTTFLLTAAVLLHWRKKSFSGKFDPQVVIHREKMDQEIRVIVYYPVIFIITSVISLIAIAFDSSPTVQNRTAYIAISAILSVTYRIQGVLITLVFTLDPETRRKLNKKDLIGAVKSFIEKEKITDYVARNSARSDSLYHQFEENMISLDDLNS